MDLHLDSKVALVVGGTGLIGSHVAEALAQEGATVVVAARDPERLGALAERLGARVHAHPVDTSDDESVARLVADVLAEHGRIDSLVITSAPSATTLDRSRDRDPAQIIAAVDTKALGFLRVAEAVAPHMVAAGGGRIVGLSGQNARSSASITGSVRNIVLITIAKGLADAYAGTGVGVNVVNPGVVREDASTDAPAVGAAAESTPHQVASLVVYLASPAAAAVSGESIAVGHKLRGIAGA
ncbi:SDR family NAD(P)-dependent oxidoreductase [Herbiconiux sp. YIM B11900]|uniref:SDR family NAD(P)-dependent oxidoreductase n=1 Tax=Herbiconiux sp. YIM B11900 TaxID=3404131 RepID=UPI003F8339BF